MQSHRVPTECPQADGPVKSSVFAAACGSRRPTLPKCFLGIVPQFGHHRLQMTFEEGAAVPSRAAAIRVRSQEPKAKHLQILCRGMQLSSLLEALDVHSLVCHASDPRLRTTERGPCTCSMNGAVW